MGRGEEGAGRGEKEREREKRKVQTMSIYNADAVYVSRRRLRNAYVSM